MACVMLEELTRSPSERRTAAPTWTAARVAARLTDAVGGRRWGAELAAEALAWPSLYLAAPDHDDRRRLVLRWLTWKVQKLSIREQLAARGWARKSFYRDLDAVFGFLADCLNRYEVPLR